MTPKSIQIFTNEIYSEPPKKIYATNKTDVFHIDDIWSLDISDLKHYGSLNNRGYRDVLVIIDNFSKFGWTTALRKTNAQTIKDSFENSFISSKRKPNLIGTDHGKEFSNGIFRSFSNINNIKLFSRKTSHGAVFAEGFNCTIRDLPKDLFLKKVKAIWIDL